MKTFHWLPNYRYNYFILSIFHFHIMTKCELSAEVHFTQPIAFKLQPKPGAAGL